ncbi:MAG: glycosyltransferase family 2 protein [Candidatus Diapherotrites archaeon]|nr:glycosyltransferase family 2 protein [Candidatus Diapherotrites archaeon]
MKGKKLVVMIPCYNEEKTIAKLIKLIPRKVKGFSKVEVLVMNDGSKDNTVKLAKKAGANKIHSHFPNKGLGVNFRMGLEEALSMGADVVLNIDADLQFNPKDIPKIVEPIVKGKADVVTATRFADPKLIPHMPAIKKFGNHFFTKIVSFILGQKFTDTQCGFRAYDKEACLRANLFGKFTYTQEVFLDLANKGLRIVEVSVKVKGERKGKSRIVKSWYSYGIKSMLIIMRTVRDNHPLKFFGSIGIVFFLLGFVPGVWLFVRWLLKGVTTPYGSLVILSGVLIILGFLMGVFGLLADMQDRQRKIMENVLYEQKKSKYK